jgi:hypothetical protein
MSIISLFGAGMAMQFEKHGDGYLYRANGTGPALPATAQERDRFVTRAGWSFLLHTAGFMLGVIGAAMLTAIWFPSGDEAGGFALMGGLLVAIAGLLYLSVRRSLRAPARALAGRAPVAPARPARVRPRLAGIRSAPAKPRPPRRGSWLLLLGFGIAELLAGFLTMVISLQVLNGFGVTIAVFGAFILAGIVVFAINRWSVRVTGRGPFDFLAGLDTTHLDF